MNDERTIRRLFDSVAKLRKRALTRSIGTVTDPGDGTAAFQVEINGSTHTGLRCLSSYTPTADDRVYVVRSGNELFVLGKIDNP